MKTALLVLLILTGAALGKNPSNKPPEPHDDFTSRATCRINTRAGVYIYYEDGQHGLYEHLTAQQLGLAYAPKCGFKLPDGALNSHVIPTKAKVSIGVAATGDAHE